MSTKAHQAVPAVLVHQGSHEKNQSWTNASRRSSDFRWRVATMETGDEEKVVKKQSCHTMLASMFASMLSDL